MTRALPLSTGRPTRVIASVDRERVIVATTGCACGGRLDFATNPYGVTVEVCIGGQRRPCGYSRALYRVAPPAPQARPAPTAPQCARDGCTRPTRHTKGSSNWTRYCGDACLDADRRTAFAAAMDRAKARRAA